MAGHLAETGRSVRDRDTVQLTAFLKTDDQLTGMVALGWPAEAPDKRPRKPMREVIEFIS